MFRTVLVHHQEQRFGAVYRIWYMPVRLAVVWLEPHNSQTYGTGIYQMRYTAPKRCS